MSIEISPGKRDSSNGTYVLWPHLPAPAQVEIGKLGPFSLLAGWYGYVGSAMGSGGLRGRLKHHFNPIRRPHWHIDYLRQVAISQAVWAIADSTSHEHFWASVLHRLPGALMSMRRFGASYCQCEMHLYYFLCSQTLNHSENQLRIGICQHA